MTVTYFAERQMFCFFATGGKMPCVEENFSKVAGELNRRICYEKVFSNAVSTWFVFHGQRSVKI
jgi:hypothetical protein